MSGPYNATPVGGCTLGNTALSYSNTNNAANFGNCVALDGSTGYLALANGAWDAPNTQPWTVECRVRTTSGSALQMVVSNYQSTPYSNWYIGFNTGGRAILSIGNANLMGASNLADGAWHTLAGTWDGTSGRLFVDGALIGTFTPTYNGVSGGVVTYGQRANSYWFNGELDEVRYSTSCLYTTSYSQPTTPFASTSTALVSLHHLDESSGAALCADSAASLTASPATIGSNATVSIVLTGSNVTFSSQTFTLSGYTVSGYTQTITDTTHATLNFTTANAGTGTLTITDPTSGALTTVAVSGLPVPPYNGTLVGSPSFVTEVSVSNTNNAGNFGSCVSLNGSTQYIQLPPSVWDAPASQPFTIEARVATSATAALQVAASAYTSTTAEWYLGVNTGGYPILSVGNMNGAGAASIADGAWHTLAGTWDGTTAALYVDGALVAQFSPTVVGALVNSVCNIGSRHNSTFPFHGAIDEGRYSRRVIYTTAYTPATAPFANVGSGTLGLYHLEADASDSGVTIVATPGSVNAASTVTISLIGAGTAFSSETFSVTGYSYTSESQTITDGTHASITLTLGGGPNGTLTITDPTSGASATVAIAGTSSLSASPTALTRATPGQTSAVTVSLTGVNTAFAGSPFSVVGADVQLRSQTVVDTTHGSVQIIPPHLIHPVTITDTQGNSATLLVQSAQVGPLNHHGDSYTVGNGASGHIAGTAFVDCYVNVFAYTCGFWNGTTLTNTNLGWSGRQVEDIISRVYSQTTADGQLTTYMAGFNNARYTGYQTAAAVASNMVPCWLAAMCWLAIPTNGIVKANGTGVSLGGIWTTPGSAYHCERTTSVDGSTMATTVAGTAVYIGYLLTTAAGGTFSVTIDGISFGPFTAQTTLAPLYQTTWGAAVRIAGLSAGSHSVVVTAHTSAGAVAIDWIAGSGNAGGIAIVGSIARMDATGYAADGPNFNLATDATMDLYNGALINLANEVRSDGLDVRMANLDTIGYNVATDLAGDHIHPNDSGHAKIAAAFAQQYWNVPRAQTGNGGGGRRRAW